MLNRIVMLGLIFCFAGSAFAADVAVEVAPGIEGRLFTPNQKVNSQRAVLLLHGWNGEIDEVGNLYRDLAVALADKGIASLRFTFSGEGLRAKYVVTSTYESRLKEAIAAYRFLQKRLPEASYGVTGFSLGALTGLTIATDNPDWFDSMVLWSGATTMGISGDPGYDKAAQLAMKTGKAVYHSWTDITLTRNFLASYVGVNADTNIAAYPGAFLSIRGTEDFLPSLERQWLARLPNQDKSFLLIGGADHIYNVLEKPKPVYGDKVIRASADWFDRTLK